MRVMISWQTESSFSSGPLGITGGYCEADSTLCVELISQKNSESEASSRELVSRADFVENSNNDLLD